MACLTHSVPAQNSFDSCNPQKVSDMLLTLSNKPTYYHENEPDLEVCDD